MQGERPEIPDISLQRHFGIGAAIEIIEQKARQAPFRAPAVIGDGSGRKIQGWHELTIFFRLYLLCGARLFTFRLFTKPSSKVTDLPFY